MNQNTTLVLAGVFLLGGAIGYSTEPFINGLFDVAITGAMLAGIAIVLL